MIEDDIARLDRRCFKALEDARLSSVPKQEAADYFASKLAETIDRVTSRRETDAQQAQRQNREIIDRNKDKITFVGRQDPKTPRYRGKVKS